MIGADVVTFLDARRLDNGSEIRGDICIVGGGAAGIAIAREFIGSSTRVVLLEGGDRDFQHRSQFLYRGKNIGADNFSPARSRFRMFGGSTARWSGQCRPMDAIDFEARDNIPYSGWPFPIGHLEPYYRRAQRVCNLGPYDYDPNAWAARARPSLAVDSNLLETTIFQFGFPRDFGKCYGEELKKANNIHIYLNANVTGIDTDRGCRSVSGMGIETLNAKRFHVVADAYVLACGGIENPRLLLASRHGAPGGLGNDNDLVGRFFMDHAYFLTGYFEPADARHDKTLNVIEDYSKIGEIQKANAALTLSDNMKRQEGLNNCAVYFLRRPNYKTQAEYFSQGGISFTHLVDIVRHADEPNAKFANHLRNILFGANKVGLNLGRQVRERFQAKPRLALRAVLETTPNPESRVMLSDKQDRFGQPRVQLNWQLNERDRRGLMRLRTVMRDEIERLGLGSIIDDISADGEGWPSSMMAGKHHMGTTRMHADSRRGVVDADCRVHGLSNLYIAGSSVFPTGGYANPTLTIVALALRLADRIRKNHQ